jgi:hypothetical protein
MAEIKPEPKPPNGGETLAQDELLPGLRLSAQMVEERIERCIVIRGVPEVVRRCVLPEHGGSTSPAPTRG